MCGNDGLLPQQETMNPLYALRVEQMPAYNPLASTAQDRMDGAYGRQRYKSTTQDSNHGLQHHDLFAIGMHAHPVHEMYHRKQDPTMMYHLERGQGMQFAYDRAARETASDSYRIASSLNLIN